MVWFRKGERQKQPQIPFSFASSLEGPLENDPPRNLKHEKFGKWKLLRLEDMNIPRPDSGEEAKKAPQMRTPIKLETKYWGG